MCDSLRPHGLQHARLPCPSLSPWVCSNSCLLSQWCHPTISSFVIPSLPWLQSFPVSGSFLMSQLFISSDQSIEASASAPVFPMNIQGWSPLGSTGLISLLSKELSRVFWNGDKSWRKISCLKHIRDKEEKWEWVWEGQGEDEKTKWVASISTLKLLCWGRTWN